MSSLRVIKGLSFPGVTIFFRMLMIAMSLLVILLTAVTSMSAISMGEREFTVVEVSTPSINCIFDVECEIAFNDRVTTFALRGTEGEGILQSRLLPIGEAETQAEGLYGYMYQIDLGNVQATDESACLSALHLDFGPVESLDYDQDGNLEDAYAITRGGTGNINIAGIVQDGQTIKVFFEPDICPGILARNGDSSFLVGLTSTYPPHRQMAQLEGTSGLSEELVASVPEYQQVPPVAIDQSISIEGQEPVSITLRGGDENDDILTFSIVSSPTQGTLGLVTPLTDSSSQVVYTPVSGAIGSDSFEFIVDDGRGNMDTATVSIQILPASGLYFVWGQDNHPIANEPLKVFCYGDDKATDLKSEHQITTDEVGRPSEATPLPRNLPVDCPYVVALNQLHAQPSGKPNRVEPAYTIYATSWRTGSSQETDYSTPSCTIACASSEPVTLRQDWPLVLFEPVVSLEWEPKDAQYSDDLTSSFRMASAYLADLTDGYMAFKSPIIHTRGEEWYSADLRFQVANDLRPSAFVGGIVSETVPYVTSSKVVTLDEAGFIISTTVPISVEFESGATYYGRYWDGDEAHEGPWNAADGAGARTIIHEWLHYALFLYDEYGHTVNDHAAYCSCADLPLLDDGLDMVCNEVDAESASSAMAFHYTSSELWHQLDVESSAGACLFSTQYQVHGESDWETLERWFEIQSLALPKLTRLRAPTMGPHAPSELTPSQPTLLGVRVAGSSDPLGEWGPLADLFGPELGPLTPEENHLYLPVVIPAVADMALVDSTVADFVELDLATTHSAESMSKSAAALNASTTSASTTNVAIDVADGTDVVGNTATQAYLLQGDPTVPPERILHQGTSVGLNDSSGNLGEIDVWGHDEDDQLRIFMDRYTLPNTVTPGRFISPLLEEEGGPGRIGIPGEITLEENLWGSSLDLDYEMLNGQVVIMRASLSWTNQEQPGDGLFARICVPDAAIGCPEDWREPMVYVPTLNRYMATFDFSTYWSVGTVPPYGIIAIELNSESTADTSDFDRLIRWFRDAGGVGPAHCHDAPLRDGLLMVDTTTEKRIVDQNCNRVMSMPATDYQALFTPIIDPEVAPDSKLIGMPLDVDILLNANCVGREDQIEDNDLEKNYGVKLTLFYSQEDIERAGLDESHEEELVIWHYKRNSDGGGTWDIADNSLIYTHDSMLNWVAVEGITEDGIYAVGWQN
ncbi:MAG: Ig-like domain-containing protein [Chloroflexota bacterium]